MDHSWGANVFRYGLSSSGATLAARSLVNPLEIYTNVTRSDQRFLGFIQPFLDTEPYTELWLTYAPGVFPHFPYGRSVEPDEPV